MAKHKRKPGSGVVPGRPGLPPRLRPEQRRVQHELNDRLVEMLSARIPTEEIARMLGAGEFLHRIGGRSSGFLFDIRGFIKREMNKAKPLKLPSRSNHVAGVIVPPDPQEITFGDGDGEYIPSDIIPRTKYLVELFTELGLDYELIHGQNTEQMMRELSYNIFTVKDLNKLVLVCDEEGNRTFIVHKIQKGETWKDYAKHTKDEFKDQRESGWVSDIIWPGDPEKWKEQVKKHLERSEQVRQNNADIESAPEGWITITALSGVLGKSYDWTNSRVDKYRKSHFEHFRQYRDRIGHVREHLSDDLVLIMKQESNKYEPVPDGWVTLYNFSKVVGKARKTITKMTRRYRATNPEWFGLYISKVGALREFFAPEIVKIISDEVQAAKSEAALKIVLGRLKVDDTHAGWMTSRATAFNIGISESDITRIVAQYRDTHPHWFTNYRTPTGQIRERYSPELIIQIKKNLDIARQ